ncbi:glycoside hydrolase family 2 protein [Ruminococcus sp. Marseille-P6503]|uniref:beta-mannosidase n=1 Tax=Ruminococcus sp. Marseille-P6503 TaxID=2364796 RepID=UPI000F52AB0D|nr:glycoside hydrolase family 2 protein [Ruminococcus sp. Marseille-P6503]
MTIDLNENWIMNKCGAAERLMCSVPCSVYKTLLEHGKIQDPYWRENEYVSTGICDSDYEFSTVVYADRSVLRYENIRLVFDGIDTLGEVYLNGKLIGRTDNMHRVWEFDVKKLLHTGENQLSVKIFSPNAYIARKQAERPLWGVDSTMEGYTHLRKAHCMFGWDWGPKLPDMGIWRGVRLECYSRGRILDVHYTQKHTNREVLISCLVHSEAYGCDAAFLEIYSPEGRLICSEEIDLHDDDEYHEMNCKIENPSLWWANGYGAQPLYRCVVRLVKDGAVIDENTTRIGLRTLTVSREKDQWGEEFCFKLNGVKIFAMGGNYIPEDQIVARCTEKRTRKLLEQCAAANFNFIRVWGGGCYPDDYFYDCCDELGLIVWQDFMFACSSYLLTEEFEKTVREEVKDNIIRLRNHASLGMWCGNNEIESAWEGWGIPDDPQSKADYLRQFEELIPALVKEYSPEIFYWPSSPSSGGGFKDSSSNHAGDMHYWDVWHNLKPIEDFRKYYYRFCSEYGFESLPCMKTVKEFADEAAGDFDLMSPVMEAHQKCTQGNEKIMFYLAQMVRYPYSFERLIYSSQLLQADCIRSNVEHMRRARGRCMGSAYWQINDSNPVISWSGIDYFGRWKGLHYYAKRFYNPALISCDDSDSVRPVLNVSNETLNTLECEYRWRLRNSRAEILLEGSGELEIPALTSENIAVCDLSGQLESRQDKRERYLEYSLIRNGELLSRGSTLFVRPKEFAFEKPYISVIGSENKQSFILTLTAESFAKSVCLDLEDGDCVFSDNWFDIHGTEPVTVTVSKKECSEKMSLEGFMDRLTIQSNYENR